jgi:hypothetical protein
MNSTPLREQAFTLDTLQSVMREIRREGFLPPLGHYMGDLFGMRVIQSPHLPAEVDENTGHHIVWHHPLMVWLAKRFPWLKLRPYDRWPMIERRPNRSVYVMPGYRMMVARPELCAAIHGSL